MALQFASLHEFLIMDGDGIYVWVSYGVTALVLGILVIYPYIKQKKIRIRMIRQQRITHQIK